MLRLIKELRRREVFRTVGLYVGIGWITIEGASVMLPAFDAPEWVLRAVIILAIIGLPVAIVLAWIYDVTDSGIAVQTDPTDTVVVPFGGRKADFVVIGILTMALGFSLYLNLTGDGTAVTETIEPISVLIADFDNQTGDAMFDGLLEQALTIGVEAAPNIAAYQRTAAQESYKRLNPDAADALDNVAAQLVAVREGIQMVLIGSIASAGDGYDLVMTGHDSISDEDSFRVTVSAKSRNDVLAAVGTLSEEVREALGDQSFKDKESATVENFTAASLEAARDYVNALDFSYRGEHEVAMALFESATQKDPNFGRAYSGWALSAYKLGRKDEADELWKQALALMNTMTERERLRTLGLYYAVVTQNLIKAKETFAELVTKYPSDAAARNNLQVVSFMTLDFRRASDEGKVLLELYPNSSLYRSNFALLATYSGEFAEADAAAQQLVTDDPDYAVSYLVIASAAMSRGVYDAARNAYNTMLTATKSEYDDSMGTFGLADIELYLGNFAKARDLASQGIEENLAAGNKAGAATKLILVAESYLGEGNHQEAAETARRAYEAGSRTSQKVSAALVAIAAGEPELAREVSESLGKELQPQSRAYSLMIEGALLRQEGNRIPSIDKLQAAIEMADLWMIRYQLGRAYFDAGFFAASGDEFRLCGTDRRGEVTAVFLDDVPTYRYLAELPYWLGRSEESLGMTDAAKENFMRYVATRPNGGPLVDDARQRAGQ